MEVGTLWLGADGSRDGDSYVYASGEAEGRLDWVLEAYGIEDEAPAFSLMTLVCNQCNNWIGWLPWVTVMLERDYQLGAEIRNARADVDDMTYLTYGELFNNKFGDDLDLLSYLIIRDRRALEDAMEASRLLRFCVEALREIPGHGHWMLFLTDSELCDVIPENATV